MIKPFSEVVLFARTGLNPRMNFKLGKGTNRYITIKNIHNNSLIIDDSTDFVDDDAIAMIHRRSQIKAGDILFCSIGRIGDMFIIKDEPAGWDVNESVFVFTLNTDIIRQKYFYYLFKHRDTIEYLTSNSSGSTFKSIKMNQLQKMVFDLPPLAIQDRIVSCLDTIEAVIESRQCQLSTLDELVKARFVEMSKNSITTPTRMGDVATYINGYAFKPTDWTTEGLPIIRIQNLNDREALYNHYSGAIDSKYQVHTGDILVSWATHLEAYLWQGGDAWLNQHIFRVIFDKMQINKIYYIYSTEDALRQAFKNAHGFKPTMEHIKRSDFEDAIILLPPIEVQNQFATFVTEVDKSKVVVQGALDEARLLFDSLMQKYFG